MEKQDNNATLASEIGEVIKEMNAGTEQPKGEATAAAEAVTVAEPKEPTTDKTPAADSAFVADDALIERAVKAGLSVADAKAFANADQADRILKALESRNETPTTETKKSADGDGDGFPADEFDKVLKEMKDDGDYDQKFVSMFEQMGSLLKAQAKEISTLKKAGSSAEAQSFFDKAVSGLDKGVRDHLDAAHKSQLKAKFDFLKSAHASAKDKATDEEIFGEAVKLAIGDIVSKAAEDGKAAALAKRGSLALARPGGEPGTRGNDRPATEEDVVNELFDQLTK